MDQLTAKQQEVYDFIKKYINNQGYSPTIREIGREMGTTSSATTFHHMKKLKEKGYITWIKNQNRTIKLVDGVNEKINNRR